MLKAVIYILEIQPVCGLITFSRTKLLRSRGGCGGFVLMMGKQLLLGELNHSGNRDINCSCTRLLRKVDLYLNKTERIPVERQKVKLVCTCVFHPFVTPL